MVTKGYVDSESENHRTRRDFSFVYNDQDTMFDNNQLANLDVYTINTDPVLEAEICNKNL